ncbi:MB12A protein, partial [Rhinopomastus cyanomelas]|nr:MB12A protein [Rhinopomastus cyanomelas]
AAMAAAAPLTGVALAAASEAVPAGWTAITGTVEGAAANLGRGLGHRGGGVLCVRTGGVQAAPGSSVVTDLQLLSDRSPQPAGYSRVPEFPEPRPGLWRKKRLLVRLQPVEAAEMVVLELLLSGRGRVLPLCTKIGDLGQVTLWCRKGPLPRPRAAPQPVPKAPGLSSGLRQLSLHSPDTRAPGTDCSTKRGSAPEALPDPSSLYGLSAMDGVPFTLHPRFENRLSTGSTGLLADLTVKTLADIEREYSYGFVVERTAAARLPPSVC